MPNFDWELDVILWLRQILPGFTGVFEAFTFLGNEMFYLTFLPILYWCLDRRTGVRLTLLFLISLTVNAVAKVFFNMPRPLDFAPDRLGPVLGMDVAVARERYEATGNGFPSGHTQNAVVIWSYLAMEFVRQHSDRLKRATPTSSPASRYARPPRSARVTFIATWILAGALMVLIPLSRLYLAVHFPRDLLGGYVLGLLLLLLYLWGEPWVTWALATWRLPVRLALALVPPVVVALLLPNETVVAGSALLMSMGAGFLMERRWVRFTVDGAWWRRVVRYLAGIVALFALYAGLKIAFEGLGAELVLRFVRYGLMGLWGSLGAPWVFVRLGLADAADPDRAYAEAAT
jgi:membrane-associated phospholipid phosphatase